MNHCSACQAEMPEPPTETCPKCGEKSAVTRLRPMGYGELLDETFDLYRNNFLTFVLISAVVSVPAQLILRTIMTPEGKMAVFTGPYWIVLACNLSLGSMSSAALTLTASNRYLGRSATVLASYGAVLRRVFPLLFMQAVVLTLSMLGGALCLVPGILAGLWFTFCYQVYMLEGLGPVASLRRSKQLVGAPKDRVMDRIFVLGLVVYLIFFGVLYGPPWILRMLLKDPVLLSALSTAWNAVSSSLTSPLFMISTTVLYYDVRVRKEGYDLQVLADSIQAGSPKDTRESSEVTAHVVPPS